MWRWDVVCVAVVENGVSRPEDTHCADGVRLSLGIIYSCFLRRVATRCRIVGESRVVIGW